MAVTAEAVKALRERTGAGMMECKKALVETGGDLDAAEIMRKSGLAKADKKAGRIAAEGVIAIERSADGRSAALVEINSRPISSPASRISRRSRAPGQGGTGRAAGFEALLAARLPSGQTVDETRRGLIARIGENIGVRRFRLIRSTACSAPPARDEDRHGRRARRWHETLARIRMHVAAINPQFLSGDDAPAEQVAREREIFVAQTAADPKAQGKPRDHQQDGRGRCASTWLRSRCTDSRSCVRQGRGWRPARTQGERKALHPLRGRRRIEKSRELADEVMAQVRRLKPSSRIDTGTPRERGSL
jgi:elongation factor Ts